MQDPGSELLTPASTPPSPANPTSRTPAPTLTHITPRPFPDPIRTVKRESIHWKRKLFHVLGISLVAACYGLSELTWQGGLMIMASVSAVFVTADLSRFYIPSLNKKVKQDFGMLMRDYELDGISGSSWFLLASMVVIVLFPKTAAALGLFYLAVGDPLASYVGVRWGRTRLWPGNKSLEGSLALFAICTIVGFPFLLATGYAVGVALALATIAAVAAAVAEWLPLKKVDDNFSIPLIVGLVTTIVLLSLK